MGKKDVALVFLVPGSSVDFSSYMATITQLIRSLAWLMELITAIIQMEQSLAT